MAWSRRIGLLCLALFIGRGFVATPAALTLTITPVANISLSGGAVPVGTAITWTVGVSGDTGPFQFQYWICDSAGWQMMQGYSTSNTFTFVPPRAGDYLLSVYVRNVGSTVESYSPNVSFSASSSVRIVSVTPRLHAPAPLNQPITWTVQASGGDALPLMFKYFIDEGLGAGFVYQAGWTSGNTFTYTPTHAGQHGIRVQAKRYNSGSSEAVSPDYFFTAGTGPDMGGLLHYVDTGATFDASKTCNPNFLQQFTGAGLTNELKSRELDPTKPTAKYVWDFTSNTLHTEFDQFGYQPAFTPDRVSFATNGRPIIRNHDPNLTLQIMGDDGTWSGVSLMQAAHDSLVLQGYNNWDPTGTVTDLSATEGRVVYDKNCNAYSVIDAVRSNLQRAILMHSMDGGRSWKAYVIPDPNFPIPEGLSAQDYVVNMEVPTTGHVLEGTPALLLHPRWYDDIQHNRAGLDRTQHDKDEHVLKLVTVTKNPDGTLQLLNPPYQISDHASTGAGDGGSENYAVSSGDFIHIVFPGDLPEVDPISSSGRSTPTNPITIHGTPAFAATYSRSGQGLTAINPTKIGVGASWQDAALVDDHNQPVIAQDSQGYLHVMIGGHHGPMYYRRSSFANTTLAWDPQETVGDLPDPNNFITAKYTYPSLVIDRSDVPFVAARTAGGYPYEFKLIAMRRNVALPTHWEAEKTLLHPGRGFYGNWYNKLSLDPWGRLFVSYGYYAGNLFSNEVAVLNHTYNLNLTTPTNPACTPSLVDYCDYPNNKIVNFGMLATDINQSWSTLRFELGTTGSFLETGPRIWLDTSNLVNHSIGMAWSGIRNPSLTDWIGIFPVGASDQSYLVQYFTAVCTPPQGCTTATAGHYTFPFLQILPAGTYEVRLFSNSVAIAGSRQFIVP